MTKWKYKKDEDEMRKLLKTALKGDCDLTKNVYGSVVTAHGTNLSNADLLRRMEDLMEMNERDRRRRREQSRKKGGTKRVGLAQQGLWYVLQC